MFCSTDKPSELAAVQRIARGAGASDAVICSHWAQGGVGAVDLATAVTQACQKPADFKFLYELNVRGFLDDWVMLVFMLCSHNVPNDKISVSFSCHWKRKLKPLRAEYMAQTASN